MICVIFSMLFDCQNYYKIKKCIQNINRDFPNSKKSKWWKTPPIDPPKIVLNSSICELFFVPIDGCTNLLSFPENM